MNEHIKKGNEAKVRGDMLVAKTEFEQARLDPDPDTQRIAENRLREIEALGSSKTKIRASGKTPTDRDRPEDGWLKQRGYHVGKKSGVAKDKRQEMLREAFYREIQKPPFDEGCAEWWGPARSRRRYEALCRWLEFRISSNSRKPEMAGAVNDWNEDLEWLRSVSVMNEINTTDICRDPE